MRALRWIGEKVEASAGPCERALDQPFHATKEPRKVINGLGSRKLHRPLAGTFENGCLTIGRNRAIGHTMCESQSRQALPCTSCGLVIKASAGSGLPPAPPVSGLWTHTPPKSAFLRLYFTQDAKLTKWRHLLSGQAFYEGPTARSNALPFDRSRSF